MSGTAVAPHSLLRAAALAALALAGAAACRPTEPASTSDTWRRQEEPPPKLPPVPPPDFELEALAFLDGPLYEKKRDAFLNREPKDPERLRRLERHPDWRIATEAGILRGHLEHPAIYAGFLEQLEKAKFNTAPAAPGGERRWESSFRPWEDTSPYYRRHLVPLCREIVWKHRLTHNADWFNVASMMLTRFGDARSVDALVWLVWNLGDDHELELGVAHTAARLPGGSEGLDRALRRVDHILRAAERAGMASPPAEEHSVELVRHAKRPKGDVAYEFEGLKVVRGEVYEKKRDAWIAARERYRPWLLPLSLDPSDPDPGHVAHILVSWMDHRAAYGRFLQELDDETRRPGWGPEAERALLRRFLDDKELREEALALSWESILKFSSTWPRSKVLFFFGVLRALPDERSLDPIMAYLAEPRDDEEIAHAVEAGAVIPGFSRRIRALREKRDRVISVTRRR
jgi:hypothetical protein